MIKNKYLDFELARNFVRKLSLSGEKEWREYCRRGLRPNNIPSAPWRTYRENGWISWGDWIGNGKINYDKIERLQFDDAWDYVGEYILKYKIDTQKKWYKTYRDIFGQNAKIPIAVDYYYRNKGWISWRHWLRSERRPHLRKYSINKDFFKVWSHDMAYILGFWWADGNIFKNTFTICQHEKDKYILELFGEKCGSNGKLRKQDNCYIFSIYSKEIVEDIIKLGGKEDKSLDIKFPYVPNKYLPDFIRGNFDGDGSVYYDKKNDRYGCKFSSCSKEFIYGIYEEIKKAIPLIGGSIHEEKRNGYCCYRLCFSSGDTIYLRDFIYIKNTELRLHRKYEKMHMARRKYKNGNSSNS